MVNCVCLSPGLGKSPGRGHGNSVQYSCLENPHGWRSLAGYSPCGCKELDTTKWLSTAHKLCLRHMGGKKRKWRQRIRLREGFTVLLTLKLGEGVTSKVEVGEGKGVVRWRLQKRQPGIEILLLKASLCVIDMCILVFFTNFLLLAPHWSQMKLKDNFASVFSVSWHFLPACFTLTTASIFYLFCAASEVWDISELPCSPSSAPFPGCLHLYLDGCHLDNFPLLFWSPLGLFLFLRYN